MTKILYGVHLNRLQGRDGNLTSGLVVLLDLLFNVGELIFQVLTPVPLLQVCWIL